jgi:hypothetical protein
VKFQQLEVFTQRQSGLVTREQFLTIGTVDQLKHFLKFDKLTRMRRNVYRVSGSSRSWLQDLTALVLTNDKYVISHRAAAQLWNLGNHWNKNVLEVSMNGSVRHQLDGVVIHRAWLPDEHITELDGLRITTLERTITDLAATSHEASIDRSIDIVLSLKRTTIRRLHEVMMEARRPGRPNLLRVATLLEKRMENLTQSWLQRKALQWIELAGLEKPVTEYSVSTPDCDYAIDIAYPAARIGIECDGYVAHGHRTQFDKGARRTSALAAVGWRILPVTSNTNAEQFVRDLRLALSPTTKRAS